MNLPESLNSINPLTIADFLFRKGKQVDLFLEQSEEKRIELLRAMPSRLKKEVLNNIPENELVNLIESLDPDEATSVLRILNESKRESILVTLSEEIKNSLSTLLKFDPDTAAGVMRLDYIQAEVSDNIELVAEKFRKHERNTGRPPVILVIEEGKLIGFMPGHELGFAGKNELIGKFVRRMHTVSYSARHNEVMSLFRSHPNSKVAVLNDDGDVIGIIYSDDVLKILNERETASLYNFAGISREESVTDSARNKVKNRYRWLIINLGTAFLAAFTVGLFEETLDKFVLLAIYMPIVAGMGGNAATQTLAVLVRGIALRQIELKTALKTLKNELGAGFINGVINGFIVAVIVIIVNHDFKLALVLSLAMVVNLLVAGLFGTIVPLIMSKLGKDPAASATIFITTATDVLGFIAFLGLGTLILS